MSELSFQEKSAWMLVLSLLLIFGLYFGSVLPAGSANVRPDQVAMFVGMVVVLVAFQIVGHVVLAILDRRTDADERDRLIALKGERNGSYVLSSGVFFAICAALAVEGNFLVTHLLLGFWVLAHLVELGTQLYLYRRGR